MAAWRLGNSPSSWCSPWSACCCTGNTGGGLTAASLALAGAAYTRPEGPLIAACCFAWQVAATAASGSRWSWRQFACLVVPFVALVGAHYLLRHAYYGDWLPNTYYAKHVRPWYEAGFRYLWAAALETGLYLLLPLAVAAMLRVWRSRQDLAYALPLLCVFAHMAYVMRIGGDHFEYRPLDFYWPLLAVPAAHGILGLADSLWRAKAGASRRRQDPVRATAIALFLPVLFYCTVVQNALLYFRTLNLNLTEQPVVTTVTAFSLGVVPGTQALFSITTDLIGGLAPSFIGLRAPQLRDFADPRIRDWSSFERVPREAIPKDAVAAVPNTGIASFYVPALTVVDTLGLTDAVVARNPTTVPNRYRVMAHDRVPPPGYLERRNVNFKPQPLAGSPQLALARARYAARVGPDLWMPFDAADHEWVLDRFDGRSLRTANDVDGVRVISDFENGWDGWQPSSDGFQVQDVIAFPHPIAGGSYHSSRGLLASVNPDQGPEEGYAAIGTARSPQFTAHADDCLGFLISGGHSKRTGLRLLANGVEAKVWRANSGLWPFSNFRFVTYPLLGVADAMLQLEVFDEDSVRHGFILLDHVTLIRAEGGRCPGESR